MKYIIAILLMLYLCGCEFLGAEKVDSGKVLKEIKTEKHLPRVNLKQFYVCNEDDGYVYVESRTSHGFATYSSLLESKSYGTYQIKCVDFEKKMNNKE